MLDLVGDLNDIVGAVKGGAQLQAGAAKRAMLPPWFHRAAQVEAAVPQQPQVVQSAMGVPRKLPLPLPLTLINPGATVSIVQRAQITHRSERIVLTSSQSPSSCQVQVFVGVMPQTAAAGFIPLDVYRATAFGVELQGNTANVGNDITVQTQNIGAVAETVGGAIIGVALQP